VLGPFLERHAGDPLHLAGHLRADSWGGRERIQFVVEDAADPREGGR